MELIGIALGIFGIVVSIAIAIWQHSKAKSAEQHLASVLISLPNALLAGVGRVIANRFPEYGGDTPLEGASRRLFQTSYADIDGDGEDELLVEMGTGAHGSILLVYGRQSWEFKKLGELFSTTMGGFEVSDVDGDGRVEIKAYEIARRPGLPYVAGLHDEVVHRFQNGAFVEVSRKECFTEGEMQERQSMFKRDT